MPRGCLRETVTFTYRPRPLDPEMNGRERLEATLRGEFAGEVPWAPLIFQDTLSHYPGKIREAGPVAFTRMIGGDVLMRVKSCRVSRPGVEVTHREDGVLQIDYSTRHGRLRDLLRVGRYGAPRRESYPITSPDQYRILEDIVKKQKLEPDYATLEKLDTELGGSGTLMAFESTTPVQDLIQNWLGLRGFYSHLLRYRSDLENLISTMHEANTEIYGVMAESPLEFNCIVENTDIKLVSPGFYARYSMGHVRDFVDVMHRAGKVAIVHMCGKVNGLLHLIRRTGLDGIDCLTPAPIGDIDFRQVFDLFGRGFAIHGALDHPRWISSHLTEDRIRENVMGVLESVEGRPFILCTAADGIPGIPINRFMTIGRAVEEYRGRG